MRKHSLLVFALVAALAIGVGTASAQDVSVGYQGFIGNGQNLLSGLSVRGWTDQIGYEGTIFYGETTIDFGGGNEIDADVWLLNAQVMYAAVVKENSKFYVGLDFGYGQYDIDAGAGLKTDDGFWMIGPLLGAEYSFQGLPELGFNWEVSYEFVSIENDDANIDIDLSGINVTLGVHYRF